MALAVAAISPAASAPPAKTDLQSEELKGPVQSVSTGFIRKGETYQAMVSVETFDRTGNLVERKTNRVDFIKIDKPERKGANTTIFHSIMGDTVQIYTFDANGDIAEMAEHFGTKFTGPPDGVTRYKRDANGRAIEEDFLGPGGKVGGLTIYTRDAAGNIISEEQALTGAKPPYPHTDFQYVFEAHGNWIKRTEKRSRYPADTYFYGPEGTLLRTITYYGDDSKH
jgi:hypothetical protein